MDDAKIGTTNIDKIYIGNTVYWQRQASSQHIELSYLQSTGTQYIDTGIVGQSGLKIEISVDRQPTVASACFIGSRVGSGNKGFALMNNSATTLYSAYNSVTSTVSTSFATNTQYVIIKDDNRTYLNGTLLITATVATFTNNLNMYIFALNENGTVTQYNKFNLYYCKIWDSANVLLRDFIPVIKDDIYCLYDKVSSTYFYNQGTGTFIGA